MKQEITSANPLPPCIVYGLESQIGLHLVRELAKAGVPVIGLAKNPNAIGLASRYLWKKELAESSNDDALCTQIRLLGEKHGPCVLLAVSESDLRWLQRNRENLGNVTPALPPDKAFAIVLDKDATLLHAQRVGLETPHSYQPDEQWSLDEVLSRVSLPCVLKWSAPERVAPVLHAHGIELIKAEYANMAEELAQILHRYDSIGQWPLVQTYCPGVGLGQFFYMRNGQALRRFQHLRIAEWPPEGGFSSVCDVVPLDQHRELQEKSIALLREIGWEGVAMVEFRHDPATGRSVLMEINGRFWGSFPLAAHAGAGFAWLSYAYTAGITPDTYPPPRTKLRCRMVATELKRLARILLQPHKIADRHFIVRPGAEILRFIKDFFRPDVCYYVWATDDPKPFFKDLSNFVKACLRRG